jgi:hypothetical protein
LIPGSKGSRVHNHYLRSRDTTASELTIGEGVEGIENLLPRNFPVGTEEDHENIG